MSSKTRENNVIKIAQSKEVEDLSMVDASYIKTSLDIIQSQLKTVSDDIRESNKTTVEMGKQLARFDEQQKDVRKDLDHAFTSLRRHSKAITDLQIKVSADDVRDKATALWANDLKRYWWIFALNIGIALFTYWVIQGG